MNFLFHIELSSFLRLSLINIQRLSAQHAMKPDLAGSDTLGTGQTVVLRTVQTVLLGAVHSHVLARPAARHIFSYKWGAAGWGEGGG